jgi:hypothetical protein
MDKDAGWKQPRVMFSMVGMNPLPESLAFLVLEWRRMAPRHGHVQRASHALVPIKHQESATDDLGACGWGTNGF